MNEALVTASYLKRKFPNDPKMRAVIDFINRNVYYLHQEYLNNGPDPEGEYKWKRNIVDLDVQMVAALGHGHELHGYLSTILGNYGNITRAYRETVMGSFATDLAGSATLWVPDDRLWEVGKGTDAEHRAFALRQYKNGFMMLANALAISAFSSGGMLPVDGSIQYINKHLELYFDEVWHDLAFKSELHPPVTIAEDSADKATIGDDQVLHINSTSDNKYGFILGGIITWLYGLTYSLCLSKYYIDGILHTCQSVQFTLDAADLVNPRIDLPVVNINNALEVLKGDPAENPLKPSIDVATQLELPFILLPANATEPVGVTDVIVFNEHVAGEFATSASGVVVDWEAIADKFNGTKSASVGTVGNNDTLTFTADAPLTAATYETLSFFLKLKAAATTKNAVYAQFRLAGVAVTQELPINWNINDITNWQGIAMKLSDFTFINTQFDSIRLRWSRVQGTIEHAGFYLDYIKLQAGVTQPVFVDTVELTGDVTGKGKTGTPFETTLKTVNSNVGSFGSATKTVSITVDAKGRITAISENDITGGGGADGREVELSTSGGYVVWRYVGDPDWIQLFQVPQDGDDGRGITSIVLTSTVGKVKTYTITLTDASTFNFDITDGADGADGGGSGTLDEIIEVYIDFVDSLPYTYTCPVDLRFTVLEYEGAAPTLSVPLNTQLTKYQDIVITPNGSGLVLLKGAIASTFSFDVYIDFAIAGAETYKCPYPLKFTAMEHEQANAPTLSIALNTDTTKYQVQTVTADAPGLVTLKATIL